MWKCSAEPHDPSGRIYLLRTALFYRYAGQMARYLLSPRCLSYPSTPAPTWPSRSAAVSSPLIPARQKAPKDRYDACPNHALRDHSPGACVLLPQIGNNLIINIKDTSVMFIIGFGELFSVHRGVVGQNYLYFPSAAIEMVAYLTMTLIASIILRWIENAWRASGTMCW